MTQDAEQDSSFMVWASDHIVYGPVDTDTLMEWVRDGRVVPKTWVLDRNSNRWCTADSVESLRQAFGTATEFVARAKRQAASPVLAQELRHFPAFSALSNAQVDQFIGFGELVEAPAGRVIIRRQDPGDSLYFLLSGELRARLMVGQEEKTLGYVKAGECFGETAMFMRTPRTADVLVEQDARMLRVSSEAFLLLIDQMPQVAAPILFGMAQVMAGRVAAANQQSERKTAAQLFWQ